MTRFSSIGPRSWLPFLLRRVPYYPQTAATECGAACLTMLLRFYKIKVDLNTVAEACVSGRHGVSAGDVARAASRFGCVLRAYACEPAQLERLQAPVILHWGFNHWVVLERYRKGKAIILDPAIGRRVIDNNLVDLKFTGVILKVTSLDYSWPIPPSRSALRIWKRYWSDSRLWRLAAAVIALSLLAQVTGIGLAYGFRALLDTVLPSSSPVLLRTFALVMLALISTRALCAYLRAIILAYARHRLDSTVLPGILDHLLHLPISFFGLRFTGDLSARVDNYNALRQLVSEAALTSIIDSIMIMAYVPVLAAVAPRAIPIIAAAGAAYIAIIFIRTATEGNRIALVIEAEVEQRQTLLELLRGIKYIRASGVESSALRIWCGKFRRQLSQSAEKAYVASMWDAVSETCVSVGPLLAVLALAYGMLNGGTGVTSAGDLLATLVLANNVFVPLGGLARAAQSLQHARAYAHRLSGILLEPRELSGNGELTIDEEIKIVNLHYSYPGERTAAIDLVSCTLRQHQTTMIVGPNGCGKSTLVALLLHLLRSDSGAILCDGKVVDDSNIGTLRRFVGIVLQDETTYGGSIRSNILLGRPEATLAEVVAASRAAELHEEVLQMPAGYETHIAEGGGNVSGGQRQRIALARALIRNPKILILDEATSHLDRTTEDHILTTLARIPCMKIIVSHRPAAARIADQILLLRKGRVAEAGPPADLLRRGGEFARWMAAGSGDERTYDLPLQECMTEVNTFGGKGCDPQ